MWKRVRSPSSLILNWFPRFPFVRACSFIVTHYSLRPLHCRHKIRSGKIKFVFTCHILHHRFHKNVSGLLLLYHSRQSGMRSGKKYLIQTNKFLCRVKPNFQYYKAKEFLFCVCAINMECDEKKGAKWKSFVSCLDTIFEQQHMVASL